MIKEIFEIKETYIKGIGFAGFLEGLSKAGFKITKLKNGIYYAENKRSEHYLIIDPYKKNITPIGEVLLMKKKGNQIKGAIISAIAVVSLMDEIYQLYLSGKKMVGKLSEENFTRKSLIQSLDKISTPMSMEQSLTKAQEMGMVGKLFNFLVKVFTGKDVEHFKSAANAFGKGKDSLLSLDTDDARNNFKNFASHFGEVYW